MALANIHKTIIARANELGFFPTQAQAKAINIQAASNVGEAYAKCKTRAEKELIIDASIDAAIPVVMNRRKKK